MIQDFGFPTVSSRLLATPDHRYIIGCGAYKPQFRVWECGEATLKFERHLTVETVAMECLGEDYSLLALCQQDRSVEVHEARGLRHRLRIPKPGRDIVFDRRSSDLLLACSQDIHRINLELGQFQEPLQTSGGVNTVRVGPGHGLYAAGLESGVVQFWDPRTNPESAIAAISFDDCDGITALHFASEMTLAVGTAIGQVHLMDLRASRPFSTRDHLNGFAIRGITTSASNGGAAEQQLISWDRKAIKIWSGSASSTTLEPTADINDVLVQGGLIAVACEEPRITSYLLPSLGPAPRWAAYLEHLTEEMEERASTKTASANGNAKSTLNNNNNFDDMKFVDRRELTRLGLDHLLGTKLLRAYMHGFLMHRKLWEEARAIAEPFVLAEHQEKVRAEALEKQRQSRIQTKKDGGKVIKDGEDASAVGISDDRFRALIDRPEFAIDRDSEEWLSAHPHQAKAAAAVGRKQRHP